jgi:hypothetical protein
MVLKLRPQREVHRSREMHGRMAALEKNVFNNLRSVQVPQAPRVRGCVRGRYAAVAVRRRTGAVRSGTTTDRRTGPSREASTTCPTNTLRSVCTNCAYQHFRIFLYKKYWSISNCTWYSLAVLLNNMI